MDLFELLKALILGIVEGITEWLPISSTGHLILFEQLLGVNQDIPPYSDAFMEMFRVVIQLGAILAVVVLYFKELFPWTKDRGGIHFQGKTMVMWVKILVACIPAAVVGILFDDDIDTLFYNWQTVAIMLIVFGIIFILVETLRKRNPRITDIGEITFGIALWIGLFQLIAAVLPGTSRSGATIIGALLIGVSRTVAAKFTFFLAVPVMIGASALKILDFGFDYTTEEMTILAIGVVSAFVVSILAIKFLMGYIKNHDFKAFGWYRIALGIVVIAYFGFIQ